MLRQNKGSGVERPDLERFGDEQGRRFQRVRRRAIRATGLSQRVGGITARLPRADP